MFLTTDTFLWCVFWSDWGCVNEMGVTECHVSDAASFAGYWVRSWEPLEMCWSSENPCLHLCKSHRGKSSSCWNEDFLPPPRLGPWTWASSDFTPLRPFGVTCWQPLSVQPCQLKLARFFFLTYHVNLKYYSPFLQAISICRILILLLKICIKKGQYQRYSFCLIFTLIWAILSDLNCLLSHYSHFLSFPFSPLQCHKSQPSTSFQLFSGTRNMLFRSQRIFRVLSHVPNKPRPGSNSANFGKP